MKLTFLLALPVCTVPAHSQPTNKKNGVDERPIFVKHLYRTEKKDGWKVETWCDCSSCPPSYPMPVWVRITPDDQQRVDPPKGAVHIKLASKGDSKHLREATANAAWELCSKMKPRIEMRRNREENDFVPGQTDFPPKTKCWEAVVKDPFNSDRRIEGWKALVPGKYTVHVELQIEKGPRFHFTLEPMEVSKK